MPSKKSSTREIIRAVVGFSVDPLAEKIATQLISRYRKNRQRFNVRDAATVTLNQYLDDLFGRSRIPGKPRPPRPPGARKPAPPHEESEEEIIARLKAELDKRNAARAKP